MCVCVCTYANSAIPLVCVKVSERYPKELQRRQKRAEALQRAFTSGNNTEIDLQRLQGEVRHLGVLVCFCCACVVLVCVVLKCLS